MPQPSIRFAHLAAFLPMLEFGRAFAQSAARADPFDHIDASKCINLCGNVYGTGQPAVTFTAGAQASATRGDAAGKDELRYVAVYDRANNHADLLSDKFGGTVDFATLFPRGAKVALNP